MKDRAAATSAIILTPCEVYWDSAVRVALQQFKEPTDSRDGDALWETALRPCFYHQHRPNSSGAEQQQQQQQQPISAVTVTLIGDKGGKLLDQINQDRAFVYIDSSTTILGVLDGHGSKGHHVAEWARHELLRRLPLQLSTLNGSDDPSRLIQSTVIDVDRDMPAWMASDGGATASFVVRRGDALYFSNTGDSQSFLVAAVVGNDKDTNDDNVLLDVVIAFATELHKPDAPGEKSRLEQGGMLVQKETPNDDARAWYKDTDGGTYGLAMSRALGDRGAAAVIAEPTVTAISMAQTRTRVAQEYNDKKKAQQEQVCAASAVNAGETCQTTINDNIIQEDQVKLFVVSCTDGLLDYLTLDSMGFQLASALYENRSNNKSNNNKHTIVAAAAELLHQSSALWHAEHRGEYRDDMAMAVVQLDE